MIQDETIPNTILLDAFTDRLRANLMERALDAIRPELRAAVEAAIQELRPVIQSVYDVKANQMVFDIQVREVSK